MIRPRGNRGLSCDGAGVTRCVVLVDVFVVLASKNGRVLYFIHRFCRVWIPGTTHESNVVRIHPTCRRVFFTFIRVFGSGSIDVVFFFLRHLLPFVFLGKVMRWCDLGLVSPMDPTQDPGFGWGTVVRGWERRRGLAWGVDCGVENGREGEDENGVPYVPHPRQKNHPAHHATWNGGRKVQRRTWKERDVRTRRKDVQRDIPTKRKQNIQTEDADVEHERRRQSSSRTTVRTSERCEPERRTTTVPVSQRTGQEETERTRTQRGRNRWRIGRSFHRRRAAGPRTPRGSVRIKAFHRRKSRILPR